MPIRLPKSAGKPYRPSNGTEGDMFMEQFCYRCIHDCYCNIIPLSMLHHVDEREYPEELKFDAEGCPTCTAFEESQQ